MNTKTMTEKREKDLKKFIITPFLIYIWVYGV
ncbi:hypothetical protein THIOSC15_3350002 [uncultured Thiomicrorhabdus sp.]